MLLIGKRWNSISNVSQHQICTDMCHCCKAKCRHFKQLHVLLDYGPCVSIHSVLVCVLSLQRSEWYRHPQQKHLSPCWARCVCGSQKTLEISTRSIARYMCSKSRFRYGSDHMCYCDEWETACAGNVAEDVSIAKHNTAEHPAHAVQIVFCTVQSDCAFQQP